MITEGDYKGDIIRANMVAFEEVKNIVKNKIEFAEKIGVEGNAFKDDLDRMIKDNTFAVAYFDVAGDGAMSTGVACIEVYVTAMGGIVSQAKLFKRVSTDVFSVNSKMTTSVRISNPLTEQDRSHIKSNNQEVWIKIITNIEENHGINSVSE